MTISSGPRRIRWNRLAMIAALILGVVAAAVGYDRLLREKAIPYFESDADHFLYGSTGGESREGIPYWVWLVLPRVFPDLLPGPGGYAALGMLFTQGRDLPIGLSRVTIGYPRVGVNCAFCHTAGVRSAPDDLPAIVPGAPAHQTSAGRYYRFLAAAASDPRFNAGTILGEIARNYRLSTIDRLLYRLVVIPGTRLQLLRMKEEIERMEAQADWGPGRSDVFSHVKFHRLGRPYDPAIGTADMMPLWNAARRDHRGFFWDGSNVSLRDAIVISALSAGASRPWLDADVARWDRPDPREMSSLRRISNYISNLGAPRYPFPVDEALAASGEAIYQAECARCHASPAARAGDTAAAGGPAMGSAGATSDTDPSRLDVWTAGATAAYDTYSRLRAWRPSGFRAADDYVPVPLDGLWLRAPYLHNGSVPSLSDLLEPPANRPARFWRGYDLFDPVKVGFVSEGAEAQRNGVLYDTTKPGNSNAGHAFGTELPADSTRALLEYLKTL